MMKQKRDYVKEVADAHTNLNVFASIVSVLEGGHLYGCHSDRTVQRIIEICKAEQYRCLKRFDRARIALSNGHQGGEA
ncbi:chorismate mutase [Bradyrhizobium sp. LA8.1]|uniref:hypothetical protein n=1 Tax=unclassified Bradyrhizobium TaxID=2631580 RepID=UPI003396A16D